MITARRIARGLYAGRLLLGGLLIALIAAVPAGAQVLDQMPANTVGLIKINHLQDTSTKLADLMQALGVTDFAPQMADPLGAAEKQSGIEAGIDKTGELAVAFLDGPWPDKAKDADTGKETPPPFLAYIPVTDYKAFLGNFTVTATEGDISTVQSKKDNDKEPAYVINWGTYAVMVANKDLLAKKPEGLKVAGLAAKQLSDKDAVIYVNWPVLKALLLPKLQDAREHILAEVDKAMAANGADADKAPVVKALVNRGLDLVQGLMQDSQATTVGINISKDGVSTTTLAEFVPESYLGKLMQELKGTDQPLLTGLPSTKYLFFGGVIYDPKVSVQVIGDLVDPVRKDIAAMGDQGKSVLDLIDTYKAMEGSVEGGDFGMVAPDPKQMGQASILQMIAINRGDAPAMQAAQIKVFKQQQDLMKSLGVKGTADQIKTTVTENAKTVEGISFTDMQTQYGGQGNTPQEMQVAQMMGMMYGPNGLIISTGVIDPKTLLCVGGGSDELLTTAITAAKANTDVLSSTEGLKLVDAQLPKNRLMVMYLPLDVIASTAVGYMGHFGMAVPVQLPPNLPPIGVTISTEGSAFRVDEFVPTPLVQSLIAAGMQVFLQNHGGQGGGGGGGL